MFTNANYLLPYTGAGSGVRRALEYAPDVIFSNGVADKVITHSANEFLITIPRKSEQAHSESNLVTGKSNQATGKSNQARPESEQPTDQVTHKTDVASSKSEQPHSESNLVTGKSNQANKKSNQANKESDHPRVSLVTRELTKKEEDIRNFCSVPRTAQEIMDRLGVTNQSKNRLKYITSLLEAGVLERTIPEKPNDPNQKYRRRT